jgi:hypothetical protein
MFGFGFGRFLVDLLELTQSDAAGTRRSKDLAGFAVDEELQGMGWQNHAAAQKRGDRQAERLRFHVFSHC